MKYMITAALALSLLGGATLAQDRRDDDRGGGGREEHRGPAVPNGAGRTPGPGPGAARPGPQPGAGRPEADRGRPDVRPGPGGDRGRPDVRPGPGGGDRGRPDFRPGPGPGGPGFDRGRPGRGPEPGLRPGGFLRDRGWNGGHFRAPSYRYPSGWGYRRWAFGAFLPSVFLGSDYFLGSYWTYGLPAPPPGYHWIRVGPDALLVRYGDGYVLDAAYGIFY